MEVVVLEPLRCRSPEGAEEQGGTRGEHAAAHQGHVDLPVPHPEVVDRQARHTAGDCLEHRRRADRGQPHRSLQVPGHRPALDHEVARHRDALEEQLLQELLVRELLDVGLRLAVTRPYLDDDGQVRLGPRGLDEPVEHPSTVTLGRGDHCLGREDDAVTHGRRCRRRHVLTVQGPTLQEGQRRELEAVPAVGLRELAQLPVAVDDEHVRTSAVAQARRLHRHGDAGEAADDHRPGPQLTEQPAQHLDRHAPRGTDDDVRCPRPQDVDQPVPADQLGIGRREPTAGQRLGELTRARLGVAPQHHEPNPPVLGHLSGQGRPPLDVGVGVRDEQGFRHTAAAATSVTRRRRLSWACSPGSTRLTPSPRAFSMMRMSRTRSMNACGSRLADWSEPHMARSSVM